eukprot:3903325-Amphidinium_carterae.1
MTSHQTLVHRAPNRHWMTHLPLRQALVAWFGPFGFGRLFQTLALCELFYSLAKSVTRRTAGQLMLSASRMLEGVLMYDVKGIAISIQGKDPQGTDSKIVAKPFRRGLRITRDLAVRFTNGSYDLKSGLRAAKAIVEFSNTGLLLVPSVRSALDGIIEGTASAQIHPMAMCSGVLEGRSS